MHLSKSLEVDAFDIGEGFVHHNTKSKGLRFVSSNIGYAPLLKESY
jgi:hypothetical protein